MALTAQTLAAGLSVPQDRATTLLATVTALVERYAPDAPEAVRDEAALRAAGWLYSAPANGIRRRSVGPLDASYSPNNHAALRHSGAMALLSPWKQRRAGVIG